MMSPQRNVPTILVTGATGLVGEALIARLHHEDVRIRALVRDRAGVLADDPGIEIVRGDLRDPGAVDRAVNGVDVVYHLGAAMSGTAEDFESTIVRGTHHVIDACMRHGVRRLVHVSSLGVVDSASRERDQPVHETSALEPFPERRGAYTCAKAAAERIIRAAMAARGLRAVIVRPGQIVGPRAAQRCPNATFAFGSAWISVGAGSQALPLVYTDDVADALVLAGTTPGVDGRIFHVIDPEEVTLNEYLDWYKHLPTRAFRTVRVPAALMQSVATVMDAASFVLRTPLPMTRYRVRALRPLAPFDVTAATQILGWTPRVGVRAGLLRTFGERRKAPRLAAITQHLSLDESRPIAALTTSEE